MRANRITGDHGISERGLIASQLVSVGLAHQRMSVAKASHRLAVRTKETVVRPLFVVMGLVVVYIREIMGVETSSGHR